jgi:DeoR family transcriptional regulator of aga operon
VQVNDLSHLYGVSTVTIRNDLAFLKSRASPFALTAAR